jgi:competence protein ComGC
MLASAPPEQKEQVGLLQRLLTAGTFPQSYAVAANTSAGWVTVAQGNQEPANALLVPAVVFPTAVMAGLTLPALAKAKDKAQSINCINNLKQIGLAAKIYAVDHDDSFPPDLESMQDELYAPRVLICPKDPSATGAQGLSWDTFNMEQSSYEYLAAGLKDDGQDPNRVLARCRIHGYVCRMDGSVHQSDQ